MIVSARDAKRIAREWVDRQKDVPAGRIVVVRGYNPEIGGRRFTVMVQEPPRGKQFMLVELYVCDDGTVKVSNDRRARVRQLFEKHGTSMDDVPPPVVYDHAEAVACFMTVVGERTATTPAWFKGVTEVECLTGDGSADAHVKIELLYSLREVQVPIKVVMCKMAKANHNRRLTMRQQERMIVMVITPSLQAEHIRGRLHYLLDEMRKRRTHE